MGKIKTAEGVWIVTRPAKRKGDKAETAIALPKPTKQIRGKVATKALPVTKPVPKSKRIKVDTNGLSVGKPYIIKPTALYLQSNWQMRDSKRLVFKAWWVSTNRFYMPLFGPAYCELKDVIEWKEVSYE